MTMGSITYQMNSTMLKLSKWETRRMGLIYPLQVQARAGRISRPPPRLIKTATMAQEMNNKAADYKCELTSAEDRYYEAMRELNEMVLIGAGIGGGFVNTEELHVMNYDEAIKSEKDKRDHAVKEEHDRMINNKVFQPVPIDEIPEGTKIMTSAWAMKKKSNGTYRARINARGFEQVHGEHYDIDTKSSPVTSLVTIRIVMTLIVMMSWAAHLMDVHGAFLKGKFRDGEIIYMKVPQGFEKFYPKNVALLLLRTIYGLVQAALAFWRETVAAFGYMHYIRSKADPCLHFKWTVQGLIIWISWVDDFLVCGGKNSVMEAKDMMAKIFDCEDVGEMNEYVGCKIERDLEEPSLRMTQPVLLQSFEDEFDLSQMGKPGLPAPAGSMLTKGDKTESEAIPLAQQAYRKGVGKLLLVTRWTRPGIMNSVRELSRFAGEALMAHMKAMHR
jgi:hypothetical protein